jgi:hypothetical protein
MGEGIRKFGVSEQTYNGSEYMATAVREWLGRLGIGMLSIEPGSLWENDYVKSFFVKVNYLAESAHILIIA